MAWAVRARTGMGRVRGSALRLRVASHPLTTGRLMSIRIRSGCWDRAISSPWAPSQASSTAYPFFASLRDSMSRFISLSSTNNILRIGSHFRAFPQPYLILYFLDQVIEIRSVLVNDSLNGRTQAAAFFFSQIFCGDNNHGYFE